MNIRQASREIVGGIVTRAKVAAAVLVGGRTFLQVTGLDGEARDGVELLHPWGYSAVPRRGADPVLLQAVGTRDHFVGINADDTSAQIPGGLAAGECGMSDGLHLVAVRNGRIEAMQSGETLRQLVTDAFKDVFNMHNHPDAQGGVVGPPSPQMTSAHLTGVFHAGGQS